MTISYLFWAHSEFARRMHFQASEVDMGRFERARPSTVRQLLPRLARGQRRTVRHGQFTGGRPSDETGTQALFQPPDITLCRELEPS